MNNLLSKLRNVNIDTNKLSTLQFLFTDINDSFKDIGGDGKDGFYQIQLNLPQSFFDSSISDTIVFGDIKKCMAESMSKSRLSNDIINVVSTAIKKA